MKEKYPVLRTRYIEFFGNMPSLTFSKPYLIVGILCPEIPKDSENRLNNLNLMPYELACRFYTSSDYQYSKVDINPSGTRDFNSFDLFFNGVNNGGTASSVIFCYLEFDEI